MRWQWLLECLYDDEKENGRKGEREREREGSRRRVLVVRIYVNDFMMMRLCVFFGFKLLGYHALSSVESAYPPFLLVSAFVTSSFPFFFLLSTCILGLFRALSISAQLNST